MNFMRNMLWAMAVGLVLGLIPPQHAEAYEELISTAVITDAGAASVVVGHRPTICVYCVVTDGGSTNIRYAVGNATSVPAATATSGSAVDYPGDCYRIAMGRGNDRISIAPRVGATFVCEVNAVLP